LESVAGIDANNGGLGITEMHIKMTTRRTAAIFRISISRRVLAVFPENGKQAICPKEIFKNLPTCVHGGHEILCQPYI
jgi:hypothetical protein